MYALLRYLAEMRDSGFESVPVEAPQNGVALGLNDELLIVLAAGATK